MVSTIIKKKTYVEPGIPPHRQSKFTPNSHFHGFNNMRNTS